MTTLLGLSGSLRAASFNTKLMKAAAARFAPDTFVEADRMRTRLEEQAAEEQQRADLDP